MPRHTRKPVLGSAFDQEQTNEAGRIENYISELEYYRPRGFSKLAKDGRAILRKLSNNDGNGCEWMHEWQNETDLLLTEWARRVTRNDFICFGPFEHNGCVGFYIDLESAKESADITIDDTSELPRGFTGLALQISDHGNVTGLVYSRGRRTRELFAVV